MLALVQEHGLRPFLSALVSSLPDDVVEILTREVPVRAFAPEPGPPATKAEMLAFAEVLRRWGECDPDPDWFGGDVASLVLSDCARASRTIVALVNGHGDGPPSDTRPDP